jgi:hypothetical protein
MTIYATVSYAGTVPIKGRGECVSGVRVCRRCK